MAIPVNIDDLINSKIVESTRIEFKSDFNPNAVIHTICAFANDIDNLGGGYIITSFPGFGACTSESSHNNCKIRVYRNRRIGDFLKELKLIEGRNTGFPNAIRALTENGSGLPQFEMDDQRGFLSVTIPVHSYFIATDKKSDKKRAYEEKILAALKDKPLLLTELAAAMGYKGITKKLSQAVDEMLFAGKVKKVADKGNNVKYSVI